MASKGFVYRIWAGITAILVLSASVGIALDVHYCQDTVKSIGVYALAKECSMIDSQVANLSIEKCREHNSEMSESCCHNESFFNKITTEASSQVYKNQKQDSKFIVPIWRFSKLKLSDHQYTFVGLQQHVPLSKNRQVLFQSFLI